MKNIIKGIRKIKGVVTGLATAALLTISVNGAVTTTHVAANSVTVLLSSAATLSQISVVNTNGTSNSTIVFYDSGTVANTNVIGSYSQTTNTSLNITNSWTNYFGVVNSNVYTGLVLTTNTIAGVTNIAPIVLSYIFPSNAVTTIQFRTAVLNGLLATNNASADIAITYRQ